MKYNQEDIDKLVIKLPKILKNSLQDQKKVDEKAKPVKIKNTISVYLETLEDEYILKKIKEMKSNKDDQEEEDDEFRIPGEVRFDKRTNERLKNETQNFMQKYNITMNNTDKNTQSFNEKFSELIKQYKERGYKFDNMDKLNNIFNPSLLLLEDYQIDKYCQNNFDNKTNEEFKFLNNLYDITFQKSNTGSSAIVKSNNKFAENTRIKYEPTLKELDIEINKNKEEIQKIKETLKLEKLNELKFNKNKTNNITNENKNAKENKNKSSKKQQFHLNISKDGRNLNFQNKISTSKCTTLKDSNLNPTNNNSNLNTLNTLNNEKKSISQLSNLIRKILKSKKVFKEYKELKKIASKENITQSVTAINENSLNIDNNCNFKILKKMSKLESQDHINETNNNLETLNKSNTRLFTNVNTEIENNIPKKSTFIGSVLKKVKNKKLPKIRGNNNKSDSTVDKQFIDSKESNKQLEAISHVVTDTDLIDEDKKIEKINFNEKQEKLRQKHLEYIYQSIKNRDQKNIKQMILDYNSKYTKNTSLMNSFLYNVNAMDIINSMEDTKHLIKKCDVYKIFEDNYELRIKPELDKIKVLENNIFKSTYDLILSINKV